MKRLIGFVLVVAPVAAHIGYLTYWAGRGGSASKHMLFACGASSCVIGNRVALREGQPMSSGVSVTLCGVTYPVRVLHRTPKRISVNNPVGEQLHLGHGKFIRSYYSHLRFSLRKNGKWILHGMPWQDGVQLKMTAHEEQA